MLGEFPDLPLGDAQHFCHFGKGAFGLEGRETAYNGAVFAPVFCKNELHHVILAVVSEINVDVGEFVKAHALFIEKTPEIKVEPDGTDAADFKAITDETVGSTP